MTGQTQDGQTGVYTLEDFNYPDDQNFQGVQADRTFNLTLPGDWVFDSMATLAIRFSHSPALNPASSMNVRWNGSLIGSILLTDENVQNGLYEMTLSPERINPGFNDLQITFFMGISEDFCIDFDNPAVWAVVHNDSSIQLTYKKAAQESDLNLAPGILIDSSPLSDNQITLVIPTNPEIEIAEALARIGTKLGRMAEWRNTDISVMTMEEALASQPVGDLVVIGTLEIISTGFPELDEQIKSGLAAILEGQATISPNDGLVFFQASPFDPTSKALSLTGENLPAVKKSVLGATLNTFYEGASGTWSVIRSVPDLPAVSGSGDLSISMDDLGMEDQTAFGTREQIIQFNLPLSALWEFDTEAWITLHFTHSELLNSDHSTLSILLNQIPVTSIPLTPDTAEDGFEEIRIPLRYFKVGNNTFTLQANLENRDSHDDYRDFCTDDTYPRAWVTILSDTAVIFSEIPEQTSLNLGHFPFGFADVNTYENFTFVLDSEFSNAALKAMGDLAVSMGKSLLGHPARLSVRTVDKIEEAEGFKYHLLIGTSGNVLSPSLNDHLPIPLNMETGALQPNKFVLEMDTQSEVHGNIQAFQKDQEDIFLLLMGGDQDALIAGGTLLADPAARATLDGNLAVFSASDQAMSYQVIPKSEGPESDPPPQPDEGQPPLLTGQSVWIARLSIGLIGLSVIVLIIALIWKNRNAGQV